MAASTSRRNPQGGPPLLAPAIAYSALTIAAAIINASGPRPNSSAHDVLTYAQDHIGLLRVVALLVFGAAVPLAVWTATVHRRLRRAGVAAPGVDIALTGGLLAAASLSLSGLFTESLAVVADSAHGLDPSVARALTSMSIATGAAGFAVPFALLVAGVAVPSLLRGLTSRPLAWAGLVLAVVGLASTFTVLTSTFDPLLPITRFGGLGWLLVISVRLRSRMPQRTRTTAVGARA